jgi:arsenite methyltransferase
MVGRKAGLENVEFLKGEIENIPLPDNLADVVISTGRLTLQQTKIWSWARLSAH